MGASEAGGAAAPPLDGMLSGGITTSPPSSGGEAGGDGTGDGGTAPAPPPSSSSLLCESMSLSNVRRTSAETSSQTSSTSEWIATRSCHGIFRSGVSVSLILFAYVAASFFSIFFCSCTNALRFAAAAMLAGRAELIVLDAVEATEPMADEMRPCFLGDAPPVERGVAPPAAARAVSALP